MTLLLLLAGASVGLAVYLVMDLMTLSARERVGSIRRAATYGKNRIVVGRMLDDGTFRDRALTPMKTGLARAVLRITPRASIETVSTKLLNAASTAGSRHTYLASKAVVGFVGFVGGQISPRPRDSPPAASSRACHGLVGFMVPDVILTFRCGPQGDPALELPDALDSWRLGRGRDGLRRCHFEADREHGGPLADEFALALARCASARAGRTR